MKYSLIQGTYTNGEKTHTGYGIRYSEDGALSYEDLALDPSVIAKLVELCNKLNLSPAHLGDVVEDFLLNPNKI